MCLGHVRGRAFRECPSAELETHEVHGLGIRRGGDDLLAISRSKGFPARDAAALLHGTILFDDLLVFEFAERVEISDLVGEFE